MTKEQAEKTSRDHQNLVGQKWIDKKTGFPYQVVYVAPKVRDAETMDWDVIITFAAKPIKEENGDNSFSQYNPNIWFNELHRDFSHSV